MRLIDADAMNKRRIDYIVNGYAESVNDMTEWGMALIEAPTIGGWIPCSERLPEERGEYLVSYHTNFMGECIDIVRYGKPLMPNDEDYKQRNCFYGTSYDGFDVVCRDVTAWMPLPESYEGRESDE